MKLWWKEALKDVRNTQNDSVVKKFLKKMAKNVNVKNIVECGKYYSCTEDQILQTFGTACSGTAAASHMRRRRF